MPPLAAGRRVLLRAARRRWFVLAAVAVCASAVAAVTLSPQRLVAWAGLVDDPVVFLAVVAGLYLVRPFLAAPLSLLTVLVGYRFGVLAGLPLALAGTVATCLLPFLLARYARDVEGLFGRVADLGERSFDATGNTWGMVAARLSPAPADAVSVGAGLSAVPPSAFVAGTVVGEVPWTLAYLSIGASIGSLTAAEPRLPPELVALLVAGAGFTVAVAYARRRRERGPRRR